ncbi:LysE family translocator [Leucobacter sp. HY1908]
MTLAAWGGLALAWGAAVAMPGPDVLLVLRLGVRERRAAVLSALGIMAGNVVWITASVLGMGALLAAAPALLPAIQLVGSAVLAWLGVQSARGGIAQLRQARSGSSEAAPAHTRRPFVLGVTTNLANPKALVFFTALLSQFLPAQASVSTQGAIIGAMIVSGVAWFVGIALASSGAGFRARFARLAPWIDVVAGALFVVIAAVIAAQATLLLT